MKKLFERFMDDIDNVIKSTELSNEHRICSEAFDEYAVCECTYKGSSDYFDSTRGQWYPGDAPEYEVTGYNSYIGSIARTVAEIVADYYDAYYDERFIKLIQDNLSDIFQDALLDEEAFEEKAISRYTYNY